MNVETFSEDGNREDEHISPSVRTLMRKMRVPKVEDLANYTVYQLSDYANGKTVNLVRDILSSRGLQLKEE